MPMKKPSPKIDFESKPKVIIDLPPVLEAFCRYVFETPAKQEIIVADRKHIIGKAINGLIEKTSCKKGIQNFENPVIFSVPSTTLNKYTIQTKYIYLNAEENEAFCDRVESSYSCWIENIFKDGYAMNMDQLSIIEVILDLLNVRMNVVNFDYIKKYDYRSRKKVIRQKAKTILKQRVLAG
jgi:hypothetical protein